MKERLFGPTNSEGNHGEDVKEFYGEFKIHASRRDSPGVAEIHTKDTDIIDVLAGSAMLVTGGTVAEPKTIASDEIRGKEIKGGESRRIGKGEVIVVPNGVPHWFKQVDGPLLLLRGEGQQVTAVPTQQGDFI